MKKYQIHHSPCLSTLPVVYLMYSSSLLLFHLKSCLLVYCSSASHTWHKFYENKGFVCMFYFVLRLLEGMLTGAQCPLSRGNSDVKMETAPLSPGGHIWIRCSWYHSCASHELWRSPALVRPTMLDGWTACHSQNTKNDWKLLGSEL